MFADKVFAWWGWPIAILCYRRSRGSHPGRALEFAVPIHARNGATVNKALGHFDLIEKQTGLPWYTLAYDRELWKMLICPDRFYNRCPSVRLFDNP